MTVPLPNFRDSAHWIVGTPGMVDLAAVLFEWITEFQAAGWNIVSSGDGLADYSAVGRVINNAGAGANGMNNNLAWFVMEDGDGVAQVCWQIVTAGTNTSRLKYSPSAKFIGGAPGPNQVPAATDEMIFKGGGSNASPTGSGTMSNAPDAADLLIGGIETRWPWRYWMLCLDMSSVNGSCFFFFPRDRVYGSTGDADPYVFGRSVTTNNPINAPAYSVIYAFTDPDYAFNASFVPPGQNRVWSSRGASGGSKGASPFASTAIRYVMPMFVSRTSNQAAPRGFKGYLSYTLLNTEGDTTIFGFPPFAYGTYREFRDHLMIRDCAVPWGGDTIPGLSFVPQDQPVEAYFPGGTPPVDIFRMRAIDTTLTQMVYWNSYFIDTAGIDYPGPGPVVDAIVDRILSRPAFQ